MWSNGFRDIILDFEILEDKYLKINDGEDYIFSLEDGQCI